jgi:hypothetical protein
MGKIDRVGTFIGTIEESAVSLTKKSSYPQFVGRLKATQKWVDQPDEMKHFSMTEPGYADWSSFNEEITAYLVLFKSAEEFSDTTKLMNYEQLQLATEWDGTSFDSLADGSLHGKTILFRVEENEYEGKTSLQVSWIDSKDADAVRGLKSLDTNEVKNLTAKLKAGGLGGIKKSAAAPAKAAPAKPAPQGKATPASPPPAAPTAAITAAASEATTAKPTAPAPTAPSKKAKKTPPPPPPAEEKTGLPGETSQGEAWEYVCEHKGENEDSAIEEAWIAACGEVLGDRDQDTATNAEWAKIRDIVIKDLALS